MKPLPRAQHSPELLDAELHDPAELEPSLAHIAAVNRWLGGVHTVLAHLTPLLPVDRITQIVDVGTGSADMPRRIVDWARRHQRPVRIHATDVHPQMRAIAQQKCAGYPEIAVEAADALKLPYRDGQFDVALISLTLHHFEQDEQIQVLRELARVSQTVIVNELRRSRVNYIGARFMALTVWRRDRLTRHDGPLSVLRAFRPEELAQLCARAGQHGQVHTQFFQRVVLVIDSASAAPAREPAVRMEG